MGTVEFRIRRIEHEKFTYLYIYCGFSYANDWRRAVSANVSVTVNVSLNVKLSSNVTS